MRRFVLVGVLCCAGLAHAGKSETCGSLGDAIHKASTDLDSAIQGKDDEMAGRARQQLTAMKAQVAELAKKLPAKAKKEHVDCAGATAMIVEALGDLPEAWTAQLLLWQRVVEHKPELWEKGYQPAAYEVAVKRWSGDACAKGLDVTTLRDAEASALQTLMHLKRPAVRVCLDAIRARLAKENALTCRKIPAAGAAEEWKKVDGAAVGLGGLGFFASFGSGAQAVHVECVAPLYVSDVGISATWAVPGQILAVNHSGRPCGEDTTKKAGCEKTATIYFVTARGGLAGVADVAGGAQGPISRPLGLTGAPYFRVDKGQIKIGIEQLQLENEVLVNAVR